MAQPDDEDLGAALAGPRGTDHASLAVRGRHSLLRRLKVRAHLPDLKREAVLLIERQSGLTEAKVESWRKKLWGKISKTALE